MDKLRQCIADKNALPDCAQLLWLAERIRKGGGARHETQEMEVMWREFTERVQKFTADTSDHRRWRNAQNIARALAGRSNLAPCISTKVPKKYRRAEKRAANRALTASTRTGRWR
jgi:hypothetical protein